MTTTTFPAETEAPTMTRTRQTRTRAGRRFSTGKLIAVVVCTIVAISTIYPFLFMTQTAFESAQQYVANKLAIPIPPTLDNFQAALQSTLGISILNSVVVVVSSTALVVFVGCMAGFGFAFLSFPFRLVVLRVIMIVMVLPITVLIPPIFKVILDLGLIDTYQGLILLYTGIGLPSGIYMMASFFQAVPRELVDSARVDGASAFRIFRSVALPLAKPAFLTLGTFTFLALWNDLLFALLVMQTPSQRTLPVAITLLRASVTSPNLIQDTVVAAGLFISTLVPLLLFVVFNRQVTQGMVAGALK